MAGKKILTQFALPVGSTSGTVGNGTAGQVLATGGSSASMYWKDDATGSGGGVACQKFTLTWRDANDQLFTGSARGDGASGKFAFVGSDNWTNTDVIRFTHDLGTGYLSTSIMDVNNVHGGGTNSYVDMGNDVVAKYVGDNVTEIDFGVVGSPSSGDVYKIVFIGQAD
ncbi:MAG: hypothetical protein CMC15_14575 [Flavobacteriaceae bacterium]|nr:hypothetical protein [Flavobacteriaceae bacterium]|tara:strand:- start:54 stop:557 length:504 start_codon:yes stop_codon:yes gene_type:complete